MSVLQPILLIGLPLALLPVIIHLIRLGINALSEDQTDIYPFSLKTDQADTDLITREDLARAIASLRAEFNEKIGV
jgi:hypothetical protein